MTPFEAGLAGVIDMDKSDFIGRDALLSCDHRTLLMGVSCHRETPAAGAAIVDNGKTVGHVTAGVPSLTLGCGIGYARFYEPGDWIGKKMDLKLPNGTVHACDIVDVPFFDIEKNIVRGVDRTIP